MTRKRFFMCGLCLALLALGGVASEPGAVVDGFVESLTAKQAQAVQPIIAHGRTNAHLTEAILTVSPAIVRGLHALNADDLAAADEHFKEAAADTNPYIATYARWFAVRVLVRREQFELALASLRSLQNTSTDRALLADEWQLNVGLLQAYLLDREAAIASLQAYLDTYPDAPAARRQMASEQLANLRAYKEMSIEEARDLMDDSRRRLAHEDSGEPTIQRQKRIVAVLDTLIAESEGGGGGGSGGGGSSASAGAASGASGGLGSGASESAVSASEGGVGGLQRVDPAADSAEWAKAYAKDREAVLTELQGDFPDRYRDLIEQYYKSLQGTEGE